MEGSGARRIPGEVTWKADNSFCAARGLGISSKSSASSSRVSVTSKV
jgi:hypothetical protein